jgi:hypothetical protein
MGDVSQQAPLRLQKVFLPGDQFFNPPRHLVEIFS